MAADPFAVPCPHCGQPEGRPCWLRWDVHGSLLAEVATWGYCTDRMVAARAAAEPEPACD